MADVGEVRYKAKVDDSGVDQDIAQTEKKIEEASKSVQNKIDQAAKKTSESVGNAAKQAGDRITEAATGADQFADALGKVKDGPIGKLNDSISQTKDQLSGVDSAFEKATKRSTEFGLAKEKVRLVKDEVKDTKEKLSQLKDAQKEAKQAFDEGKTSAETYQAISRSVLETKADLESLKEEAKVAKKEMSGSSVASSVFSKLGSAAKTAGSVGLTAVKGIGTAFVGLTSAAAAGVTAVAKVGIEYNAQMQTYQTAFTTMLGDAEKAQALTDNLKTLAAKTPLAMTDLADASQILLAFGSTADQLPDQLKRLGDVSQGNAEKLGTMATAFGRIQSNGYASLEEINMMIDQGFNPLQIIADKTGESMAEVRDRVSEGKVSFEEISEALETATDAGGQFYNAMENQSQTFEGQMSTLQDNVNALAGTLTEDLFGALAESALPQVNAWVEELLTAAQTEGVTGAVDMAGTIMTEALTAILNAAPSFIETAASLVTSFLSAITAAAPQVSTGAIQLVMTLAQGLVDMAPNLISTATTLVVSLVEGIAQNLPQILSMAGQLIMTLGSGLIQSAPSLISAAGDLIAALIDAFFNTDWISVGKNIISGIINGVVAMAGALVDAAKKIASSFLNGIKGFFGIASPSKVMRDQVGKQLDAGIGVGLKEGLPEIDKGASTVSRRLLGSFSADVDYNLPDLRETAKSLSASVTSTAVGGARIEVPVSIDGREVARATAWYMGEQLAWEER